MAKKLEWGCKVKSTHRAVMGSVLKDSDIGIFLGYHMKSETSMLIVKAKCRTPYYYHVDFWEAV